jgi:hypothetical protein
MDAFKILEAFNSLTSHGHRCLVVVVDAQGEVVVALRPCDLDTLADLKPELLNVAAKGAVGP